MPFIKIFKQHESLKNASFKAKLGYFWDYYRVHTFAAICIVIIFIIIISGNLTKKDTVFYAAMVYCSDVSEEATSSFRDNYSTYAGIDLGKHEVQLDSKPSQLMLTMAAAQVDVIVSGPYDFSYEAAQNTFYDLREILTVEQLTKYEPYFYYADQTVLDARKNLPENDDVENAYPEMPDPRKPDEMEQPIPVGLFVTDCTVLTEAYDFGNDYIALGVVGNAPHLENTLKFIDYLFESL